MWFIVIRFNWRLLAIVSVCLSLTAYAGQSDQSDIVSDTDAAQYTVLSDAEREFARGDVVAAMTLLREPASQGFVPAQVLLAYYLDYAEEDEDALRWYLAAAEAGNAEAQFKLGKLYATGEGTSKNPQLAMSWFLRSGEQGYPAAIRMLANSFELGGELSRISYEQAVKWLEVGVQQEDVWSINRLARAYQRGELGLRINRERAELLKLEAEALANRDE